MSLLEFIPGLEDKKPGLMIIDFSQVALSTIFATFKPNEDYDTTSIKICVLNTIRGNVKKYKTDYPDIVLALDNRNYWRKDIAPYYKGHRAKGREKSEWDFDKIYSAINSLIIDLQSYFPYKIIDAPRCEADDIAGVLCKEYHNIYEKILLISSDSDWLQLQQFKNVKQFSLMHGRYIHPKTGNARTDLLYKAIRGDRKDAISNIRSSSDAVITGERQKPISESACLQWIKKDPMKVLDESMRSRFIENMALLDLLAVPETQTNDVLKAFNAPQSITSRSKIYPYLIKNGMTDMIDKISDF